MTTNEPNNSEPSKKPAYLKFLIPLVLVVGAAIGTLQLVKMNAPEHLESDDEDQLKIGSIVPDFHLIRYLDKKTVHMTNMTGKVFFVNFWATWCEACVAEMPGILALSKAYKDQGLNLIAINLDQNPDSALAKFLPKFPGLEPYLDPDQNASDLFDVHAIPFTVILDANHKVLFTEAGEREWNGPELHKRMDAWLNGK